MSSSATTRPDTEIPALRSEDLFLFPSCDTLTGTVNDFPGATERSYLTSRLRPYSNETSVFLLTSDSHNPRSFIRVSRTDRPDSSGTCSYLDVLGPACFTTPESVTEEVLLPPNFTVLSITTGLDKLNDSIMDPKEYTSPELKKLWSTIMSNQGWVAKVITRLQAQTEGASQAARSGSD
ncbi:hypothetical protein EHS25_007236 [Saitozyma podzolica]|uniref:Uncharacterized protein n=1 Tax=Saitozyma podzolica TaxID=1890683 RepID=A0A427XMK1_9TREE|nr:hypothetical protein EHS25_007236 [Saitozyma podzolica]